MLDADTKRRIDTARDILVGKVPDPKSQVEQITIALIYKFMDDIDAESEELGGKRQFFADGFARYGWANLMRPDLGGHETLNLYADAITRMPENPGIPPLFRDIFNNAYLPYRDPETLRAFLKVINEFSYDHSERLGDAFEYLLSVLGSQGDAGQFRTPRHIIDFIVAVVDPKKDDVVLDPACGTAGFLISSYKHILAANTDNDGSSTLTPDERGRFAVNFKGYDISPDMVRLSLVNMYLHGFVAPQISEYDTLTSDERWNEYADVILANPPFMSPKGGIRPHNRFSVKSKRSEVLFVDYMAEHLTTTGRAGIIVPEGIIFQSQKAHTALRKMLVEEYLVAVVSLPAGVFNPYSGVKTSILILDKALARRTDRIAFFKVEADGFDLGAQRRPVDRNDLPQAQADLAEYLARLRAGESVDEFSPIMGLVVEKDRVAADGDYNLGGERYRESLSPNTNWPLVPLGDVCDVLDSRRRPITKRDRIPGPYPYYGATGVLDHVSDYLFDGPLVLVGEDGAKWASGENTAYAITGKSWVNNHAHVLRPNRRRLLDGFLIALLVQTDISPYTTSLTVPKLNQANLRAIPLPLPPLEVQREIVAEIEGYQRVIDGARAVVENYRPHIAVDPEWPVVPLASACQILRGKFSHRPRNEPRFYGGEYPFIQTGDVARANGRTISYSQTLNDEGLSVSKLFQPPVVVVTIAANIGATAVLEFPSCFPDSIIGLIPRQGTDAWFLELMMRTKKEFLNTIAPQSAQKNINIQILKTIELPLPPIETQKAIVADVQSDQTLVDSNRELAERMEKKIQAAIGRVWGEDATLTNKDGRAESSKPGKSGVLSEQIQSETGR